MATTFTVRRARKKRSIGDAASTAALGNAHRFLHRIETILIGCVRSYCRCRARVCSGVNSNLKNVQIIDREHNHKLIPYSNANHVKPIVQSRANDDYANNVMLNSSDTGRSLFGIANIQIKEEIIDDDDY